jgi:hypothetical protein
MASPRPSAVVRLSEKIETSVNVLTARSVAKVAVTAAAATKRGRRAERNPRNTINSARNVNGAASSSALRRSFSAWSPVWRFTSASPPTPARRRSVWRVKRGERRSVVRRTASSSPEMRPRTSASVPSSLRNGAGCPTVQYEKARSTPGCRASSCVSSTPAARISSESTALVRGAAPFTVMSTTKFGVPPSNCSVRTRRPTSKSDFGATNPPRASERRSRPRWH